MSTRLKNVITVFIPINAQCVEALMTPGRLLGPIYKAFLAGVNCSIRVCFLKSRGCMERGGEGREKLLTTAVPSMGERIFRPQPLLPVFMYVYVLKLWNATHLLDRATCPPSSGAIMRAINATCKYYVTCLLEGPEWGFNSVFRLAVI